MVIDTEKSETILGGGEIQWTICSGLRNQNGLEDQIRVLKVQPSKPYLSWMVEGTSQ